MELSRSIFIMVQSSFIIPERYTQTGDAVSSRWQGLKDTLIALTR
jgi:hypothetical protein